jgi:hypothetical protein
MSAANPANPIKFPSHPIVFPPCLRRPLRKISVANRVYFSFIHASHISDETTVRFTPSLIPDISPRETNTCSRRSNPVSCFPQPQA